MDRSNEEDMMRGSVDSDIQASGKKCYICLKGFNFRKKHICKFCFSAVCSDHCQRSYQKEPGQEALPICDLCLQSTIKKDLEREIQEDILSLEEELKQAKLINNRLERDHFEKTAQVSKFENSLEALNKEYLQKISELEHELQIEELETKEIVELYQRTKEKLNGSRKEIQDMDDKTAKGNNDLENMGKQLENLKETKEGLNQQLFRINEKLKGSLSIEKVEVIVCEPCKTRLSDAARRRREMPSILEDATISLSAIEERQSMLESVREYKEILEKQTNNPNEESGCLIC
jgi:chromosome segregation ATPase